MKVCSLKEGKGYKKMRRLQGFSILELLLVLVIASMLVFLGIDRYQAYQYEKDVAALRQNVNLIFEGLVIYYRLNCHVQDGAGFGVSVEKLKEAGLWPNLIKTDFVTNTATTTNYNVGTTYIGTNPNTQQPIYQLVVKAQINNTSSKLLTTLQQDLNATSLYENSLLWQRMPNYSIATTSSDLWIGKLGLAVFKQVTDTSKPAQESCAY